MPLLGVYPRELKTYVHTKTSTQTVIEALFINSQKVKTIQMSVSWWVDKENVVHYNRILFATIWMSLEILYEFKEGKHKTSHIYD